MMTATGVKGIVTPKMVNHSPSNPRRPKAIRNAKLATAGGRTVGRSMSVSSRR